MRLYIKVVLTVSVAIIAATIAQRVIETQNELSTKFTNSTIGNKLSKTGKAMARTPVYFVSHGGPTTMFEREHPVYAKLQDMGREITKQVKPAAVVVFSAHWQSDTPNAIEVNTSEQEPLLYDFYGFPKHYYQEKYPNKGSSEVAEKVIGYLQNAGIRAVGTDRGLDHGVFVPFKIMFDPDKNPLKVPIVQVSLFDTENAGQHIQLGRAVERMREENVLVIVSGMAVHNLRDLWVTQSTGQTMPYSVTFDEALREAVETAPGESRDQAMVNLLKRPDARKAHPTFEHLLPIHVGVGAAGNDAGKQLWTLPEGSMSWGQYRFGEIAAA